MEREDQNELFWNASYLDIKRGFTEKGDKIHCLICEECFTKGEIYPLEDRFYDAQKMVQIHIQKKHTSVFDYILKMNPTFLGISEIQQEMLELFSSGITDKEIAAIKGISASTIRNYRYKFREKEKQAKLFLALMELLEERNQKGMNIISDTKLCDASKTAKMLDDRFNITEAEKKKVIATYFNEDGTLKEYPAREKRKVIVLEEVIKNFQLGKKYSESDVNVILKHIYEDFPYIRRSLIEYGFLDRTKGGEEYWVKE